MKMNKVDQPAAMSTVAKKFVMALSGLGLVGFVIIHLLGNLALYKTDGTAFNTYAKALHDTGTFLIIAEIGLLLVALVHVFTGFRVTLRNRGARPQRYRMWRSKGGSTPSNLSSRHMILSGIVLLVFIVIHVWQFRFGPVYTTMIHGEEARDLHRLVVDTFKNPAFVVFYVFCMLLLGMHLRHGFWSAFQSLGTTRGPTSRKLLMTSTGLGVILAVGFLFIPVFIYFFV